MGQTWMGLRASFSSAFPAMKQGRKLERKALGRCRAHLISTGGAEVGERKEGNRECGAKNQRG